jgi:hypothetical protein
MAAREDAMTALPGTPHWTRRLLREPLLHFALAGGLLFALHAAMRGRKPEAAVPCSGLESEPSRIIELREADLQPLREAFRRSWKREPDLQQLGDLVQDVIADEILYREGRARGLANDDSVVRQRVIEKMRALARPTEPAPPTREQLARWFARYAHRFVQAPRLTFEQIYFDPKRRNAPAKDAAAVLASGASDATSGDDFALSRRWQDSPQPQVVNAFGSAFALRLGAAALNEWIGPVESDYGIHLVRVTSRTAARMPSFAEAEAYVRADYGMAQMRGLAEVERSYAPRYRIELEGAELQRVADTAALRGLLSGPAP